jgi:hypothetical protein
MNPSLFAEWVDKYFPGITLRITQRYNDTKLQPTYLYRRFLRKDFSVDGKWESLSINNSLVAADIIAMDSSIPLKARPTLGRASGDIPKMGMELALREKQLTDLQTLIARQSPDSLIVAKIFQDVPLVIGGQYERIEAMFLEGLSSGITEVDDTETVGTGVRINYGYLDANKFESSESWDNVNATPFTDMQAVLDKASVDGNVIIRVMLDRTTWNNMAKTNEAKNLFAAAYGIFGASIPVPTFSQMNTVVQDRYGFVFEIVDRSVRLQKDGTNTTVKPWKTGSVVFITTDQIGSLVYARLAEQDHPVEGVNYQTVDDFILVSKFRMNRPSLAEFTNSQSRVVPVIDNPDAIYLLDSTVDAG